MAKGKSSASSATRKKHARKAAGGGEAEPIIPKEKKPKSKEKGKKGKEVRKKVFIPPVKPAPVLPDPLDTLGVAQRISPELLVVLRKLAKKDSITKRRALEELQTEWVDRVRSDGHRVRELVEMIPVWFHHVPALFLHPSRRIRILAVGLHSSLFNLPSPISEQLLVFMQEIASADQAELILGTWCMAAHDNDRQFSSYARHSWDKFVSVMSTPASDSSVAPSSEPINPSKLIVGSRLFSAIWGFIQRVILDPGAIYLGVSPSQSTALQPPATGKVGGRGTSTIRKGEEVSPRSRGEDEEENESDRDARLRIGALGASEWVLNTLVVVSQDKKQLEEAIAPLDNAALWTSLYHAQAAPFVPVDIKSFGWAQPVVRKSAWSLMTMLLSKYKDYLKLLLPTLATVILRSAWVEPDHNVRQAMWKPLLVFLRDFPNAWDLDALHSEPDHDDNDDEGSESEEEGETSKEAKLQRQVASLNSKAYSELLQFLELGCNGTPLQGYPAILVIVSTISPQILASVHPPVQSFFASFWAAIDGRALSGLDRAEASLAFLAGLLECTMFMARRILTDSSATVLLPADETPLETSQALVAQQMTTVWEEISTGRLKLDANKASQELIKALTILHKIDKALFDAAWASLRRSVQAQFDVTDRSLPVIVSASLKLFNERFERGSRPADATAALISEALQSAVAHIGDILEHDKQPNSEYIDSVLVVLEKFSSQLFQDEDLTRVVDETVAGHTSEILSLSPPLIFLYLTHRHDAEKCNHLWHSLLSSVAQDLDAAHTILPSLLDAVERGYVPAHLRPKADELDKTVSLLLAEALSRYQADRTLHTVQRIFEHPSFFITGDTFSGLVSSVSETFYTHAEVALRDNPTFPLETFNAPLLLLTTVIETQGTVVLPDNVVLSLLPNIFMFAYLIPRFRTIDISQMEAAEKLWKLWLSNASDDDKTAVNSIVKSSIRDMLTDCFALARPSHLIQLVTSRVIGWDVDIMQDIFPNRGELDAMLDTLPSGPEDRSMAVLDPLVLLAESDAEASLPHSVFDSLGLSSYARIVTALSLYFVEDRHTARQNIWALRHLLALTQYGDEILQVPLVQSPVFETKVGTIALQQLSTRVQQLTAYLLVGGVEDRWLTELISGLITGKRASSYNGVSHLLHDLILDQAGRDSVREARILHSLLQHILPQADVSTQDGDQLILIARKIEVKAPHIALALMYSVTKYCPEPPRLDRLRNELAAGLLGIPASRANEDGLWSLRRLVAIAPDPGSDVIYLPTPRAVNLLKACQQWITSDEDIEEEVELEMTSIFVHLAPILQNVPGSHWDLIFDMMENNLEAASLSDSSTLPLLARTLKLFATIQDLSTTNKTLRAVWQDRERVQLSMIRDLIAQKLDPAKNSGPLSVCRELAISIIQDLPDALIDRETLPKMCHLVMDSSQNVQRSAYHVLREAAAKYTEHVVVEAAVDTDAAVIPELPSELIDILQRSIGLVDEGDDVYSQASFGNLLTWMLIFDMFTNASLKVKSNYIEHLQRLNLISEHFLPHVLGILGLYGGMPKAFKLDIWAVEEFYLELYSSDTPHSLQLLAAHLYFRALMTVPSLFRSWLLDCRDRQLSTTVTSYTSTYFSPAIIRTELAQVKDPVAAAELVDENMKVKVASAVNEVTASYAVDEYQLELKISLPLDWPLHSIEIQDKRIGVSEDRWRAWILGVRQILTFRSGSIVDGLSFFKRNVASHFEGQTECAICYSMISATDSSLPKKPCKTCKNRFHAGCLYKWFSTSHSSSCPLCRSEIMN